ncbi:MAG: non-canonical purine NTP pyrophosphatase, partial [Oscillospiraceae bacterium]
MKQVFAATHNQHKLIELLRILGPRGIEVFPPPDPERIAQVVEDGESFADNALIKARALFADTGMPSLADDSGLCVDALGGRPGVYSARYLGEETPYDQKMAGLLRELEG